MENEVSDMQGMDISNATNIHSRLQQVPAYLTKDQKKEAEKLSLKIERYLNTLKVEWLLEKYRELSNDSKIAFLKAIGMEKDQADLASEVNSVRKIRKIIR